MPSLQDVAQEICARHGFTYVEKSGEGAFKETFRVADGSGAEFALKVFKGTAARERSQREIEALSRCRHPNIVEVEAVGSHGDSRQVFGYFVERFVSGGTLTARIVGEELDRLQLIELGRPLVSAVTYLKSLRLVHRDIKPDNILLDGGLLERPVLVDFGLVRDLSAASLTQTFLGKGPGTPLFASPEQLLNQKELIAWQSDQFGLAVVLALSFLGFHPFDISQSPFFQLLEDQREDVLQDIVERIANHAGPIREAERRLKESGLSVLVKMMSSWPVKRFAAEEALRDEWEQL